MKAHADAECVPVKHITVFNRVPTLNIRDMFTIHCCTVPVRYTECGQIHWVCRDNVIETGHGLLLGIDNAVYMEKLSCDRN